MARAKPRDSKRTKHGKRLGVAKASKTSFKRVSKKGKKKNVLPTPKRKDKARNKKTIEKPRKVATPDATAAEQPLKECSRSGSNKEKKDALTVGERAKMKRETSAKYVRMTQAKRIWEKLRRHKLQKNERSELMDRLLDLITGHMYNLTLKHDTARVIQCLLKFGCKEARDAVFRELKEHIAELSKLRYAKFTVTSLFKYGTPLQRNELIAALYGHVPRLVRHREAASVVETAYNEYANLQQRRLLVQEFYGPQFAVYKDGSGRGLGDILADLPDEKGRLLSNMKNALVPLVHKGVMKHSIVHRAMLDFLLHADAQNRAELIEAIRESCVEILHTKEGARVTLQCLWHGTTKDRKVIVKSFKTYVSKICKETHGYVAMMGVFDCVDDTVLIKNALLSEIVSSLLELSEDKYGRRVLLYLLAPRSHQHFTSQFLSVLTPGDGNKNSKKPQDVRWAGLLDYISQPLIDLALEKAGEWACDRQMAPLLVQILASAKGEVLPVCYSLCAALTDPFLEEKHIVTDACGHCTLKKIAAIRRSDCEGFPAVVVETVSPKQLQSWTRSNRGCFVINSLVENGDDPVVRKLTKAIEPCMDVLENSELAGAKVLVKNISNR